MNEPTDPRRDLLRHTLATLAYRGGKAVRDAPPTFASFRIAAASRTPVEILAHIGDLLDWALRMVKGEIRWVDSAPLPWPEEVARFYASLSALDACLDTDEPPHAPAEKVFQGPLADALTHVGQLTMLRSLAGCKIRGENYFVADIAVGRVGAEQAAPHREFD
ncbi:MAG: hypothetical protein ABSB63_08685 [Spirochaetia bacterium]|jgi:hypothetical protein